MKDHTPRGRSRRSGTLEERFAPAPRSPQPEDLAAQARPARAPGGTESVLVIEDQDQVREATRTILERLGYRVATARGAEEALRFVGEGHELNLLIIDVVLPSMNGVALGERIVAERPGVRVLFMSGLTSEAGVPERSVGGEPCAFLLKPFSLDGLARGVRGLLDRNRDEVRAG